MIQKKVTDFFALEGNYPDLDGEGAAARLSAAIRCKTINYFDHSRTDYTEFDKLHAHIKASYPNIMRVGTFERIGHHAVLITIPGSDASLRPCLYMSHQDVVPVVEGTEQDWTHPAFSGDIADGYIWGRGTLDIKEQVFGVLEAAEYLLARGKSFARTAYLAFGDDEETINLGALAIAEHLKAQGVTLEFVLDEGGCKIEPGTAFGAPETAIVSVQLMEKGYADLELSVHSIGGHSSRPYGGTSLGRLSGAIADITRAPFAVHLNSAMTGAFETLAPYITQEPLKTLVQDVAGNADAIAACCMGSPDLFPFVTTTIAPTMIRGGSAACNVMPQDMTAVINFRIADGDSTESVMAHCREAVQDKGVEMRFLQANDPSAIARRDGYGYRTVVESFQRYYPEAVFIPSMTVGATDAHRYGEICDTCLRCSPFMTEPAEAAPAFLSCSVLAHRVDHVPEAQVKKAAIFEDLAEPLRLLFVDPFGERVDPVDQGLIRLPVLLGNVAREPRAVVLIVQGAWAALHHLLGNIRIAPRAVQKRHEPRQHIPRLRLAEHVMAVGAVVDVRARIGDLLLRDAEALHVRKMRAERLVDRVRHLPAQKADLLEVVGFLKDRRKNFHVIPQVQIILHHIVAELFLRQRAVRHLRHKRMGQIPRPERLCPLVDPLGELHSVLPAHLWAMSAT